MSKMRFKLNRSGVRSLMQSPEMQAVLKEKASAAQSRLGPGYESDIYIGQTRANAMVWADSFAAKVDNMKNNSILKAVR